MIDICKLKYQQLSCQNKDLPQIMHVFTKRDQFSALLKHNNDINNLVDEEYIAHYLYVSTKSQYGMEDFRSQVLGLKPLAIVSK